MFVPTFVETASSTLFEELSVTVTVPFEYVELVQEITLAPATFKVIVPLVV